MTVASTTRKTALFAGDNATTNFPFTFKVFAAADLLVVRRTIATGVETELTLTTHYTVTLNADQEANPGGIVALLAPLLDTYNLIISSKISILQPAALANQGGFYPKVIMDALDRLTIISQQLKEEIDRCAKVPITTSDYTTLLDDIAILATQTGDIETVADNIGDVVATGGSIANVNAVAADLTNIDTVVANLPALAGKVSTTLFDANTILKADADDTPVALEVAEQRIIGRKTGGNIAALTGDEVNTIVPIVLPRGYLAGLGLSNAADADHDITIAAGTCRDSTNAYTLTLASALTKQIDAAWAAGTNAGGLDTGAVGADTFYYVYLIRKDSDGSIDALFSASATAPTMPEGYTYFRRIGALRTNGSANILNGAWNGDTFTYNTKINDRASAALANTNRTVGTLSVPPNTTALLVLQFQTASGAGFVNLGPTTDADIAPTTATNSMYNFSTPPSPIYMEVRADASSQIYYRGNSTNAYIGIQTLGWRDDRGKDS